MEQNHGLSVRCFTKSYLDASHDYDSVLLDVLKVAHEIYPKYIVFDDYGAEEGVKKAVLQLVFGPDKILEVVTTVGEKGMQVQDGRVIDDWEGVICRVIMPPEKRVDQKGQKIVRRGTCGGP
jgi:hypothetical protein